MKNIYTKSIYGLIIMFVLSEYSLCQNINDIPEFSKLRTPTSPAFVLLGIEPTSVEKPNTPSDLAFSVLNSSDYLKTIPSNFALEVSPYWLFPHSKLTWQEDTIRSIGESICRTTTISFATGNLGSKSDSVTGLALGLRTSIFSGTMNKKTIEEYKNAISILTLRTKIFSDIEENYLYVLDTSLIRSKKVIDSLLHNNIISQEEYSHRKDSITEAYDNARTKLKKRIDSLPEYKNAIKEFDKTYDLDGLTSSRTGFFLDLAFGAVWGFKNAIYDSAKFNRLGVWLTPSYNNDDWSGVGVIRYFHYDSKPVNDILDIGVRLIYANNRYAISSEYVNRTFTGNNIEKNQNRFVVNFDYLLMKGIWLSATFGKGFEKSSKNSLIAIAGINFNLNEDRYGY